VAGSTWPLTSHLSVAYGGAVGGAIAPSQSARDIRPYRGLMGAL
jgi:hypothetical protein